MLERFLVAKKLANMLILLGASCAIDLDAALAVVYNASVTAGDGHIQSTLPALPTVGYLELSAPQNANTEGTARLGHGVSELSLFVNGGLSSSVSVKTLYQAQYWIAPTTDVPLPPTITVPMTLVLTDAITTWDGYNSYFYNYAWHPFTSTSYEKSYAVKINGTAVASGLERRVSAGHLISNGPDPSIKPLFATAHDVSLTKAGSIDTGIYSFDVTIPTNGMIDFSFESSLAASVFNVATPGESTRWQVGHSAVVGNFVIKAAGEGLFGFPKGSDGKPLLGLYNDRFSRDLDINSFFATAVPEPNAALLAISGASIAAITGVWNRNRRRQIAARVANSGERLACVRR